MYFGQSSWIGLWSLDLHVIVKTIFHKELGACYWEVPNMLFVMFQGP